MVPGSAGDEPPGRYLEDTGSGMLYKRGRLLGEGTFGCCYQLTAVASGRVYAAKVTPRARLTVTAIGKRGVCWGSLGVPMQVEQERELHGRLRHPHIVRLHGHFADHGHVYLLLEFCSRGSLADILRARGRLTEPEVRYYLRQIIAGLSYLHGQGIVHRDLKPSNFLVTEKMQVKIGDLGLARQEALAGRCWGVLCGTPGYLAPEVLDRKGHGVPSDIWALGCTVYAVLTGVPPFEAEPRQELYRQIRAARYPPSPHLSPRACALLARVLAPAPAARPSLRDILDHGFFTQGFTPATLPPRACRSPPVFVGHDPLGRAVRAAAAALARGWPCRQRQDSPPATLERCPLPPPREAAGPQPGKHPLRETFISAGNRLKSS